MLDDCCIPIRDVPWRFDDALKHRLLTTGRFLFFLLIGDVVLYPFLCGSLPLGTKESVVVVFFLLPCIGSSGGRFDAWTGLLESSAALGTANAFLVGLPFNTYVETVRK